MPIADVDAENGLMPHQPSRTLTISGATVVLRDELVANVLLQCRISTPRVCATPVRQRG